MNEDDGGAYWDENGSVINDGFRLDCPDSRRVTATITGYGPDILTQLFLVDLLLIWEVIEN